MPLLIHAVAAWITGLIVASLSHSAGVPPVWWTLGVTVVAGFAIAWAALARWRSLPWHPAAIATVAVAALNTGASAARHRQACVAAIGRLGTLRVAIDDRARPGARLTGLAIGTGPLESCSARAVIRVSEGRAPPGAIVTVTGAVRATDRGVQAEGTITPSGEMAFLRAWRGRTGESIDSLFGKHAALVRALLIADQDGIPHDVRERFADAGLVHMLSISGLHVAIVAGALLTLAGASGLPRSWAAATALAVVATYVMALGAPPPAVRSAVMLATVALTERLQRPVHPWTALALGAVIPTVQPDVVLDLGWQLSVGGMAALVAAGAVVRRMRTVELSAVSSHFLRRRLSQFRAFRGWRVSLIRALVTGVLATLVTAPLIAWTFGRISLVAPLSNIAAEPIIAVLQPALFLAIVIAPWHSAAQLVADACVVPIALLDRIATLAASVPWATLHIAPTYAGACCAGLAAVAFVRTTSARRWTPGLIVAAGALAAAFWASALVVGNGRLEVHMLDVGQGDAIAIRTPKGRWVLVDAGRRWDGGDAGRRVVVPYVQRYGGAVAAFVMSHAHDDHVGGATSVLRALHPAQWWEPAFVTGSDAYRSSLAELKQARIRWQRVHPGDSLRLDGVLFQVLAPDSAWTAAQHDANETSVVLRVRFGQVAFLLTGDAEAEEEAWVVEHTPPELLRADVLKLGHHGSRTSSTAAFIDAVQPVLGLISVGAGNRYGHPSPETLGAFQRRGIPVLRTDRDGGVIVSTNGLDLLVSDRRDRWAMDRRVGQR